MELGAVEEQSSSGTTFVFKRKTLLKRCYRNLIVQASAQTNTQPPQLLSPLSLSPPASSSLLLDSTVQVLARPLGVAIHLVSFILYWLILLLSTFRSGWLDSAPIKLLFTNPTLLPRTAIAGRHRSRPSLKPICTQMSYSLTTPGPIVTPTRSASLGITSSTRRRPSALSLRIVIDTPSNNGSRHADSGRETALSPLHAVESPEEGLPPRSVLVHPTSASSLASNAIFQNPEPFSQRSASPPSNGEAPVAGSTGSAGTSIPFGKKNVKKLSLSSTAGAGRPQLSPTPSTLSLRSVAPHNVPVSLPSSPHHATQSFSLLSGAVSIAQPPTIASSSSSVPTRRRASVMSLPAGSSSHLPRREIEDEGVGNPYEEGPIEVLPGVWLGAEENAVAWDALSQNNISAILNVAKEVTLPLDTEVASSVEGDVKHFKADPTSGRQEIAYLHLMWSHGQSDLVAGGFPDGLDFIDQSLARGTGVLIHCQCGISRSATLVIAYVMRAAYRTNAPPYLAALKKDGMQGSYQFVKAKSNVIGPNMSLIYQLLEYERTLAPKHSPQSESSARSEDSEEEEWLRRRQALEEDEVTESRANPPTPQSEIEKAEARELDQRMIIRRNNPSRTSLVSAALSSDAGGWPARSSTLGDSATRRRALSVASSRSSLISADSVIEVDEGSEDAMMHDLDGLASLPRKASDEMQQGGPDGTVLTFPSGKVQQRDTFVLQPVVPWKRKSAASLGSVGGGRINFAKHRASLDTLSVASSTVATSTVATASTAVSASTSATSSRRTSDASMPSSGSDGLYSLPSASATNFSLCPSTTVPFPRRRSESSSLGPPPVRRRNGGSSPAVLDTVPPSPSTSEAKENELLLRDRRKSRPMDLKLSLTKESVSAVSVYQECDDHVMSESSTGVDIPTATVANSKLPRTLSMSSTTSKLSGSSRRTKWLKKKGAVHPPRTATIDVEAVTPQQTLFNFPASPPRSHSVTPDLRASGPIPVPSTPSTAHIAMNITRQRHSTLSERGPGSRSSSLSSDASSAAHSATSGGGGSRRKRLSAMLSSVAPSLSTLRSPFHGGAGKRGEWNGAAPSTPTTATAHVEARGWVVSGVKSPSTTAMAPLSPLATARPFK